MNKKIATILASLLIAGFASAQEQATTPAPAAVTAPPATAACDTKGSCTTDAACTKAQLKNCYHNVLTPDERHRFCAAKAKALAANPSLANKGQKHALCDAILKEDSSMEPILTKLKKHCEQEHKKLGATMHSMTSAEAAPTAAPATK